MHCLGRSGVFFYTETYMGLEFFIFKNRNNIWSKTKSPTVCLRGKKYRISLRKKLPSSNPSERKSSA
jgi:hypothetical protein